MKLERPTFSSTLSKLFLLLLQLLLDELMVDVVTIVHESLEDLVWAQGLEAFIHVGEGTSRKHSFGVASCQSCRSLSQHFLALSSLGAHSDRARQPVPADTRRSHLHHNLGALGSITSLDHPLPLIFCLPRIVIYFFDFLILVISYYLHFLIPCLARPQR